MEWAWRTVTITPRWELSGACGLACLYRRARFVGARDCPVPGSAESLKTFTGVAEGKASPLWLHVRLLEDGLHGVFTGHCVNVGADFGVWRNVYRIARRPISWAPSSWFHCGPKPCRFMKYSRPCPLRNYLGIAFSPWPERAVAILGEVQGGKDSSPCRAADGALGGVGCGELFPNPGETAWERAGEQTACLVRPAQ